MNLCHRPARVRPASFRRDAYYTQRGGLYDLQDTSETTTKSWLRTLVVLGDQNRSQTIDRHASGLRAPGETRATQPDNAREAYPQIKRTTEEVSSASTENHNDTRGAYRPRRRRVLQKELASYPRGARRPKPKPNHRPARVRPASLRRNACHKQPDNAREAYPQIKRTTEES